LENTIDPWGVVSLSGEGFHRLDTLAGDCTDRYHAGRLRSASDEHRAAHALAFNATGPRALEPERLASNAEAWGIRIDANVEGLPVDLKLDGIHCARPSW